MERIKVSLIVKGGIYCTGDVICHGTHGDILCNYKEAADFSQDGDIVTSYGTEYDISGAHVIDGDMIVNGTLNIYDGTSVLVEKNVVTGCNQGNLSDLASAVVNIGA